MQCRIHGSDSKEKSSSSSHFSSSVFLRSGGETASLRSIVAVLALGIQLGTEIEILADGPDEAEAVDAVMAMVQSTTDA